jgi:hypothetical protein
VCESDLEVSPDRQLAEQPIGLFHRDPPDRVCEDRFEIALSKQLSTMSANNAKGRTRRRQRLPRSPIAGASAKHGSTHHSLRRFVACYPVLRMGAPEHSPWQTPRDELNDSACQGIVLGFSIFQPKEVALVGEPERLARQLEIS